MGSGRNGNGGEQGRSRRDQLSLALKQTDIPREISVVRETFPGRATIGRYISSQGPVWYALIHGDGMELLRCLPDRSVDQLATDIPYDEVNRPSNGLRNLDKGAADVLTFALEDFVEESIRVLRGTFFTFCGSKQLSDLLRKLERYGLKSIRSCVWTKPNPSPTNARHGWLSALEHGVFGRMPGTRFHAPMGKNFWEFPVVHHSKRDHSAQKPQTLMQLLIRASSRPGNLVVDPCFGSGTTAEAAITLGRHFIGAELEGEDYLGAVTRLRDLSVCQPPKKLPERYEGLLT